MAKKEKIKNRAHDEAERRFIAIRLEIRSMFRWLLDRLSEREELSRVEMETWREKGRVAHEERLQGLKEFLRSRVSYANVSVDTEHTKGIRYPGPTC